MTLVAQWLTTILAFAGKEVTELVRRPGALVSLVVGPILVMVLFGLGFVGFPPPLQAIVVVPPDAGLPTDVAEYGDGATGIEFVEVVSDLEGAEERLRAREIDAVIVVPDDLRAQLESGEQADIEVLVNLTDPMADANAAYVTALFSAEMNQRIVEVVAREAQAAAEDGGAEQASAIPPEVIAEPTDADLVNLAPVEPSVVPFYGAAMIAFVLQHLAVSLSGLSLIRERRSGSFELFRVSRVSATEIVLGKVLAFAVIAGLVAVGITLLLTRGFGVPLLGDPLMLVLTFGLVTGASLGLGVVIAMIADSERQVVQLSLLLLLASIFFTGFVLSLDLFTPFTQPLSNVLPATHGIALTRDFMLYGWTAEPWRLGALAAMAALLLAVGSRLVRRAMAHT
jgi:ABC-2 type transport system permease protein